MNIIHTRRKDTRDRDDKEALEKEKQWRVKKLSVAWKGFLLNFVWIMHILKIRQL